MRDGNTTLVLAKPRNPVPRASPNPIGVARRVSGIWVHAPFLYERLCNIIPLITLYERCERDARPPCVSECPIVPECPNIRRIPSVCAYSPTRRPTPRGIHRRPTLRRRFATPVDAVSAADADGRRRTRNARRCVTRTFSDDATTRIRTRDDEDAFARARRSERAMGLETALLRNHERLGKIALTGGFAFGFAYTTKTGTSPLAGWGWTPRTREASARAATAND